MDDSHSPWWLVVLLGIGVIGLAVWQTSRFTAQVRLGAVLLALLYLAFVAFSIGGDPRGITTWRSWNTKDYLFVLQGSLSLVAAVALVGRPHPHGRAIWFGLMSLSNAGICAACQATGIAIVLAIMAVGCGLYLIREQWCGRTLKGSHLWPKTSQESDADVAGSIWLAGGTGFVVSVLLIGTIHYALRVESSRATPTRRLSALPATSRIRSLLDLPAADSRTASGLGHELARRTDLIILLGVLAFVTFSATATKRSTAIAEEVPFTAESDHGTPDDDVTPMETRE